MKFLSQLVTKASGSVGGITYAHNRGGMIQRARRTPVNTNTAQQQAIRNAMAMCVAAWNATLTEDQRNMWRVYAAGTPVIGKLGTQIQLSGLNMFCRGNVPRIQAGLAMIATGPDVTGLPVFTNPTLTYSEADQEVSVTFTNTDTWANVTGSAMLVYLSMPQNVGKQYFAGPYRYAGKIAGATGSPPSSPATIAVPWPIVEDQAMFGKIVVVREDARLSSPFRGRAVVGA